MKLASFLIISLVLFSASSAKAEGVLDKIQRTGVLNLAIREDAPPFGYSNTSDELQGYCLDFFALLRKQLTVRLDRSTLSLKLLKSTPSNRFNLVSRNLVALECGPNTIRADVPENVDFSTSFFVTGTQFLVENDSLNLDGDLKNARLGVINNTTTAEFIAQRYPSATLQKYRGVTARSRGIQAVEQGQIDAMISDGILLRAAAQRQGLSFNRYALIPDVPLTCDRYGMIVAGNDNEWLDFVNSVINSPEAAALSDAWFGRVISYIQAEDFCKE